ncbi:MAG: TolC family protein [Bacteroidota bacterium]|nr:TolC family protein [Bacteroidota bacterium]MDP4234511.1 TolC family protein [Bacteroidota bacterium]MDP4242576.1 TolC family protein [Bacteroidota bacterium]MDP4288090.1 TolC family protein [Bacteroidota bacterium]
MKALFITLLSTVVSSLAMAQGTAPSQSTPNPSAVPQTLTLDDAIKAAIERNYTVRTIANNARRDQIEVTRSKDNLLPSASANGSWQYNYSLQSTDARTSIVFDKLTGLPTAFTAPAGSHTLSYTGSASFNLYHGGSDVARINGAEASLDGSQNTLQWTRQDIAYNVTKAFINVLRTNELVGAADTTLAEGLAQLRLIRGKYEAGVVPIGQVYTQQALVGSDSLGLIQAQNDYENAKADVLFLLNVSPNEYNNYSFSLAGIDTSIAPAARAAVDMNVANARLNTVIDNRPDILAQRQSIQATEYAIDNTRGALLPKLDAVAGIGGSGDNSDLMRVQLNHRLFAGLTLQVPLFDQMQNRLFIEEQEVDLENQRIQLEQDVQQIRSDAAKAVNNLQAASKALDATETGLTAANESLRLGDERLRVGAGTQVDVIIAEAAAVTARTNRVNAKYNYVLAQRQLAYTLGQWKY